MTDAFINSISFGIFSPELISSIARVRIVTSDLYDADGYPVEGGVMDPRLGVIDPGLHCRTCGGGIGECLGHFGYLELAKPIINVLYTKTIYQLLKVSCRKCGRLMLLEKSIETTQTIPSKCPHCNGVQKKITFVKPYSFYEDNKELSAEKIRERFEKIPTTDLKKVGFKGGRPEWLILTLFPIPPVTIRPSITLEGGERSEDDLTHKLVDIVRINQSLKENIDIGAPEFVINDLWELVQYHISTYFDNELTNVPLARHRSGRTLKGLTQRLKAKEGRMRGNLLGKRVNFSARTVISPDPRISINEVGVPEVIANELTIPMHVNNLNMKKIRSLFRDNKINYVIRPDGRRIKVMTENRKDILDNLAEGWIVDRQLQDGDVVLFNRQPSLHRISIMSHNTKIMPYKTFRLNPSVCPPYNADFDGDEMNLHVLQTEEAKTEATFLMQVQNNIISPKFGGPIIGLDLDQISGIYLLTRNGTMLSREEAAQLLADAGIEDTEIPEKDSLTGKEVFSLLLPKGLSMEFKANCCKNCDECLRSDCKNDAWVSIHNGEVKTGTIDSKAVGAFKGAIINQMRTVSDNEELKTFIDRCGRLGIAYIMRRGFSIGISDIDLPQKTMKEIETNVSTAKEKVNELIKKYKSAELKILPGIA